MIEEDVQALTLDSGGYGGTYKAVGGRRSLDFVNTISWRHDPRRHDWLHTPGNAARWAHGIGIIDRACAEDLVTLARSHPESALKSLDLLHQRRTVIYQVVEPLGTRAKPSAEQIARLNSLLAICGEHRRIDPERLQWAWQPPAQLEDLAWAPVQDAADLLTETDADLTRIGRCAACSWLFYDTSRNRSRRWCDMADCGSRDKANRYYRRRRQESSETGSS